MKVNILITNCGLSGLCVNVKLICDFFIGQVFYNILIKIYEYDCVNGNENIIVIFCFDLQEKEKSTILITEAK